MHDRTTKAEMMKATGRRLYFLRSVLGLSQAAAARRCGISQSGWAKFELGERSLDWPHAFEIARCFRVSLDFLYLGLPHGCDPALILNVYKLSPGLLSVGVAGAWELHPERPKANQPEVLDA